MFLNYFFLKKHTYLDTYNSNKSLKLQPQKFFKKKLGRKFFFGIDSG